MNKRNLFSFVWLLALGTVSLPAQTKQAKKIGDFIESTSYNEHKRGAERTLQYYPEGDDFVCINGKNRFTRALYGSWSPFVLKQATVRFLLHTISVTANIFVSFCKAGDCQSLSIRLNFVKPDILPADVRIC